MSKLKDRYTDTLLSAGVRNLKEFGYRTVTTENIVTDYVYSGFFKSMLEETKHDARHNPGIVAACESLLKRIEKERKVP